MGDVVEFGEVKLHRARNRHCTHKNIAYDRSDRTITCKDCGRHVDSFDAFMRLIDQYSVAMSRLESVRSEIEEAKAHNIRRIAARKVDKAWSRRGMVPACPHCGEGIFPEDKLGDVVLSKDYAKARLRRNTPHEAPKAREELGDG